MVREWESKAWGWTRCSRRSGTTSTHELKLVAGGYSSLHWHRSRSNHFLVTDGHIRLVCCYAWQVVCEELVSGEWGTIEAGVPHQFQVLDHGSAIEHYIGPDESDIERLTIGGLAPVELIRVCAGVIFSPSTYSGPDLRGEPLRWPTSAQEAEAAKAEKMTRIREINDGITVWQKTGKFPDERDPNVG